LKEAVAISGSLRIVFSEVETQAMLKDILQTHTNHGDVVIALGPEGGWTDEELELFQEAGWISASLGNRILRAETAAIASLAVVLAELRA
jgi:16S rRNA (uracil1498-N3)-methyltransferase